MKTLYYIIADTFVRVFYLIFFSFYKEVYIKLCKKMTIHENAILKFQRLNTTYVEKKSVNYLTIIILDKYKYDSAFAQHVVIAV